MDLQFNALICFDTTQSEQVIVIVKVLSFKSDTLLIHDSKGNVMMQVSPFQAGLG